MRKIKIGSMAKLLMVVWRFNITLTAVLLFYNTYIMFYDEAAFFSRGNIVIAGLYLLLIVLFVGLYGGYKLEESPWRDLSSSFIIGLFLSNAITYVVLSLSAKKLLGLLPMICLTVLQIAVTLMFYLLAKYSSIRLYPTKRAIAVISDSPHDLRMLSKIDDGVSCRIEKTVFEEKGDSEDILSHVKQFNALVLGNIDGHLKERLGCFCYEHNIKVIYIPSMHDIVFCNTTRMIADDSLVYSTGKHGFTVEQLIVKRLIDIGVSLVGLIVASPIMLLTALAIKLQDGGPVFFRQQRLTRGGRTFMLIKFRSMVTDAEKNSGARLAMKNDSRITKVGRFIRATRIDELPQMLNILKGDMTLVGPRPERPELFEQICRDYPEFRFRLKVKAGLTGFAQLYGKYNTTFEDKARMDVLYIERASLLQDIQLIFYTVKVIFTPESTEGVDDSSKSEGDDRNEQPQKLGAKQ